MRPFQYDMLRGCRKPERFQWDTDTGELQLRCVDGKCRECYDLPVLRDDSHRPLLVPDRDSRSSYTRKEVCRLLKVDARQLRSWERQGLIPERIDYRFSDLLALKRLIALRDEDASPRALRQALDAVRSKLGDMVDLADIRVYKDGRRVRVQIGKQKMEPLSGQLLFDFAEDEIAKILQLPTSQKNAAGVAQRVRNKLEADRWFERGLELEQTGAPFEQIVQAYQKAAELDPKSAGALVNLGTVFFNGHDWTEAEAHYRRALAVDPHYALAHFNLGNLYDERGDTTRALHHYHEALRLQPKYADAHYNLALLHQAQRDVMSAVRHWRAYLKLDSTSTWAHIARRELSKLEATVTVPRSAGPSAAENA
jgi:tetratricopeptide (TPR) repeat protein